MLTGILTFSTSKAATFVASTESEAGLIAGNARSIAGSGASGTGTNSVVFGTSEQNLVDVTTYGAVCNGVTDDQSALQRAFDQTPINSTVYIPGGKTCAHSDQLQARRDGLMVAGPGNLLATNVQNSSIHVTSPNITISNLIITGSASIRDPLGRSTAAGIYIENTSGTVVRSVTFQGKSAGLGLGTNGIFNYGGSNFIFDNVTVNDSKADCIHNTFGANNGTITNAIVRNCGDDGIAVVSYHADGKLSHDITIDSPKMYGQTWGRGMTVVGGTNITYRNFYIERSFGAAIYVGTEGNEYDTYPATNIKYLGGTIVNANTGASQVDHGAILVTNYINPTVTNDNIEIRDVSIQNTTQTASKQVCIDGAPNTRIQFINIAITGGPANIFVPGSTPGNQYNTTGWTYNGNTVANHTGFTP